MRIMKSYRHTLAAALVAAAALTSVGCTQKITITNYPEFYSPELQTVAVVPFTNQTNWRGAGEICADKLATALRNNGAYKVYNRSELKSLLNERDLQIAFGGDAGQAAGKFRELGTVQAMIIGTVTNYSGTSQREQRREPVYSTNRKGESYVSGYRTFVFTRNEGNVAVTANLVRVRDGEAICAAPAAYQAPSEGSPPGMDANACVNLAADNVVWQLVTAFAPTRQVIKINPSEALIVADGQKYDDKWPKAKKLSASADNAFVVLTLPVSCDRNRFGLTIVRKDDKADLVSQNLVWDRNQGEFVMSFSPKEIAAKGGGPGDYEVKFYSGPEPVIRMTFKIQ